MAVADHPEGVATFVSSGHPNGSPIYDGFECSTGLNEYGLLIECFDDPPENCNPDDPELGPCTEPNPGVGGCNDPECCELVCLPAEDGGFNPLCCEDIPLGWIQQCADAAVILCKLCPWDCDGSFDRVVGVADLLALLSQYDPMSPANYTGGSCDVPS